MSPEERLTRLENILIGANLMKPDPSMSIREALKIKDEKQRHAALESALAASRRRGTVLKDLEAAGVIRPGAMSGRRHGKRSIEAA